MRRSVSLVAGLADGAKGILRAARRRSGFMSFAAAVPGVAVLGQAVGPDRAGRLVPMPEDTVQPGRSLLAYWVLGAAVALVVLILAVGFLRRRWKAGWRPRPDWLAWGRDHDGE